MELVFTPVVKKIRIITDKKVKGKDGTVKTSKTMMRPVIRKLYIEGTEPPFFHQLYRINVRQKVDKTGKINRVFSIVALPFPPAQKRNQLVLDYTTKTIIKYRWDSKLEKALKEAGMPADEIDCYVPYRFNDVDDKLALYGKQVERFETVREVVDWLKRFPGMNQDDAYSVIMALCNDEPI
jgi:hypothetical protein